MSAKMRVLARVRVTLAVIQHKCPSEFSFTALRLVTGVYSNLEGNLGIRTVNEPKLRDLVNFGINESIPVHRWYYFKEGYSSRLVERMIEKFKITKDSTALDPFAGSGTTLLTCQWRGIHPIGVDINPFFSFVEQVKLDWFKYDCEKIEKEIKKLSELSLRLKPSIEPPNLSSFKMGYTPAALSELLLFKEHIDCIEDRLTRDFLRMGLSSILEDTSLMKKDGKSLKFVENKRARPVKTTLLSKLREMLYDVRLLRGERWSFYKVERVDGQAITFDVRRLNLDSIGRKEAVDFVMFSPPYLNTFDYTEVYKLELWFLDFVRNYDEFKNLRMNTLRSHNLCHWKPTKAWQNSLLDEIIRHAVKKKLWSNIIPVMIQGYFDDMFLSMSQLHNVLKPSSYCIVVVGNSSYGGIPVPTDLLLASIGRDTGFEPIEIEVARQLLTSSQQLANIAKSLRPILRESILVMKNAP